jgi:Leucine-rich repeat (LRR) protein
MLCPFPLRQTLPVMIICTSLRVLLSQDCLLVTGVFSCPLSSALIRHFCRTREDKAANPERLSVDNRQLTMCPLLEGEERLRLLNYQNNNIQAISNVGNLPNLIFLDLYNNSIKSMAGLQSVTQLRVLMLGKNKISKVLIPKINTLSAEAVY